MTSAQIVTGFLRTHDRADILPHYVSEAVLQEILDLLFLVFGYWYIPLKKLAHDHNRWKEKIVNFAVISPSYWSYRAAAIVSVLQPVGICHIKASRHVTTR